MLMLWVLSVGGAALVVYLAAQLYRYRGSDMWPIAEATIETAEVRQWPRVQGPACYVFVTYSFLLDGVRYSGDWNGPNFGPQSDARDYIRQNVPVGAKVPVRYKPAREGAPPLHCLDIDPYTWAGDPPVNLRI